MQRDPGHPQGPSLRVDSPPTGWAVVVQRGQGPGYPGASAGDRFLVKITELKKGETMGWAGLYGDTTGMDSCPRVFPRASDLAMKLLPSPVG